MNRVSLPVAALLPPAEPSGTAWPVVVVLLLLAGTVAFLLLRGRWLERRATDAAERAAVLERRLANESARLAEVRANADALAERLEELQRQAWRRRRLGESREQARRLESLGVLAGGIAHDFNNILAGITGSAELALHDLAPESETAHGLEDILQLSERAADLCRQMLACAGKAPFQTSEVELDAFLEDNRAVILDSVGRDDVELVLGDSSVESTIQADRGQLQQVLLNLVINAAEAIEGDRGRVEVAAGERQLDAEFLRVHAQAFDARPGLYVYLEVADNGPGIPPETLERIFDPFFTTKFLGRGLGLAAVFGIVRRHHGFVTVRSSPEEGTIFRAWLPVSEAAGSAVVAHPERQLRLLEPEAAGTVLIVDDEPMVRKLLSKALERDGFSTVTAEDGLAAVSVLRTIPDRVACVLLDMTMPRMDGEATLREMKTIAPELPIVVMSGHSERQLEECFQAGEVAAFLPKPFELASVLEAVHHAIAATTEPQRVVESS